MKAAFLQLVERLFRCPAVAYHEDWVAQAIVQFCDESGLGWRADEFGNLYVSVVTDDALRPLVLAAHMDHPGFVLGRGADGGWTAEFRGGVGERYFQPGIPLLAMPGHHPLRLGQRMGEALRFTIEGASFTEGAFAVWDLEEFSCSEDRIQGRACDDLIGVAAALSALVEAKSERVNLTALLSRAEEVGFHGALAAASAGELPEGSLVVSLETSRELPPVKMGEGVILRVGDRASIFGSAPGRYFAEIAGEMAKREPAFRFQRALMSGGTCEATAYQEFGYESAALCVALGNYHNCGPDGRIEAEFVSLKDCLDMVRLLVEAARRFPEFDTIVNRLPERLAQSARQAAGDLRNSKLPSLETSAAKKR